MGEYLRNSLSCIFRLACNVPSRIERDFHHEKTNKQTSSRRKEAVFHILLGGNRRLSYLFWQDQLLAQSKAKLSMESEWCY